MSFVGNIKKFASGALKTFAEPRPDGEGPTEASAYKQLLVELQYNQLLVSREYQELFKQKEEEIRRLKQEAGLPVDQESESVVLSPKKEQQGAKPLKELSPDEIKIVLKEWERKMKTNITQKTEALAEAQIYRESVELLRAQLDSFRDKINEQTAHIAQLEKSSKRHGTNDHSRAEHEAAIVRLGEEFQSVQKELDSTRNALKQAELEIDALRKKADSDAQTLALLSQGGSAQDSSELQAILKQREEESDKIIEGLKAELAEQQAKFDEEMRTARTELEKAQAKMAQLQQDLDGTFAMQADLVSRTKMQAEEETAAACAERDDALNKLKEKETTLKEAMEKLSRAEGDLLRVSKEYEEVVSSRSLSSQQDLEQKESALQSARQELLIAERALDELKSESASALTSAKAKLDEKNGEMEALSAQIEALEQEKSVLATMGAKSVEETAALKSRIEVLARESEETIAGLRSKAEQDQAVLQSSLDRLTGEHRELQQRAEATTAKLAASEAKLVSVGEELSSANKQLIALAQEKERLEEELTRTRSEATRLEGEIIEMKRQIEETSERIAREVEKVRQECLMEQERRLKEQSETHAAELAKARKETAEFRDLYAKETQLRRAAHDELMDIKGNIRVFARVRPVLPDERRMAEQQQGPGGADIVTEFPPESGGRDLIVKREGAREGADAKFEFDRVFEPDSKQEAVFETVAPLIVSVMDGVNVTLFAYGQTGSGKTFTMEGTKEDPGVNIRALRRVFEIARERSQTYSYTFSVSVLEVYLETILDLLGDVESKDAREKLDIRQNGDTKQVFVQGLVKRAVTNMEEVGEILQLASKNRTVGAHNMNEHSSRSHLVFTLTAVGTGLVKKERIEGNLNLIDLAGSERVGKTDATGDRLKEAQSINKSLSALGDVINALSLKNSHIPFRNSKLTYLLQDQLGGNAKVGFFANVSPTAFNGGETICTLNFAQRCRKTELGKARKNVASGSETVEQLMKENAQLKRQLEQLQGGGGGSMSASKSLAETSFTSTSDKTPTSTPVRTPVKSATAIGGIKRGMSREVEKD